MDEAKQPVGDEVNVEELARQKFSPVQQQEHAEQHRIEQQLNQCSGPACEATTVIHGEPRRFAQTPQAAAVQNAAEATQHDRDRRDEREPVAGDAGVAKEMFGNFHRRVTAQQRAGDGFAGGENHPAMRVVPVQPAFRAEINELRAEERARKRGDVNKDEPVIAPREPGPEQDARENAREHQPAIGGGVEVQHGCGVRHPV